MRGGDGGIVEIDESMFARVKYLILLEMPKLY